jgi:hypothetical protein
MKQHIDDQLPGSGAAVIWSYDPVALDRKEVHNFRMHSTELRLR